MGPVKLLKKNLLLVLSIFIILSFTTVAQSYQRVYENLSSYQIESCLDQIDYIYYSRKYSSDGDVYWLITDKVSDIKIVLVPYDYNGRGYGSLLLFASFVMSDPPSLERLNYWNQKYRYTTAYKKYEEYERTLISSDFIIKGGVTKRAVVVWIEKVIHLIREFAEFIGFRS